MNEMPYDPNLVDNTKYLEITPYAMFLLSLLIGMVISGAVTFAMLIRRELAWRWFFFISSIIVNIIVIWTWVEYPIHVHNFIVKEIEGLGFILYGIVAIYAVLWIAIIVFPGLREYEQ